MKFKVFLRIYLKFAISSKPDLFYNFFKKSIFLYYFYCIFCIIFSIFIIWLLNKLEMLENKLSLYVIVTSGIRKCYSLSDVAVVDRTLDPNPNPAHQGAESAPAGAIKTARVIVRVREKKNERDHTLGHDHGHHLPPFGQDQHHGGPALPRPLPQSSVIRKKNKVVRAAHPVLTKLFYTSICLQCFNSSRTCISKSVLATRGVPKQTF